MRAALRAAARLGVVVVLALAGATLFAPGDARAEPPPTMLQVSYQTLVVGPGEQVSVRGSVGIGDQPAPAGVPVDITLDGENVLGTVTSADGGGLSGSFAVPGDLKPGERQLIAMVEGDATRGAAVHTEQVQVTGKRASTGLTAQLPQQPLAQDERFRVDGTVTRGDNKPAGGVAVTVVGGAAGETIGSGQAGADGKFAIDAVVPTHAGAGPEFPSYPVVVRFAGADDLGPSESAGALTLSQPPAVPSPDPGDEQDADDSISSADDGQPAADAGGDPADDAAGQANPGQEGGAPAAQLQSVTLVPLWMVLVGAAGFIALIGVAMIAHRRRPDENARLLP